MTNYSSWDSKAAKLAKEAEDDEKQEKDEADKALGLEGGPKGPPTAKAEGEIKDLGDHSEKRKEFIDWSKKRETSQTHKKQENEIILEGEEVKNMALRLVGSEDVTYVIPEGSGIVKLSLDKCKRVRVQMTGTIVTSTIEAYRCVDVTFELTVPVGTFQIDECTSPVSVIFAERDHVGRVYHQNSPGLSVGFSGAESKLEVVGRPGEVQLYTRTEKEGLFTDYVRRGEGEFPIDLPGDKGGYTKEGDYSPNVLQHVMEQSDPESAPKAEEDRAKAELKRLAGNEMFRANDFMQAAMEYTSALQLDPAQAALYANRSVCWLKLGNHDKALEDAIACTETDSSNAKGWFRKGMALHAMERYPEAIPALLEAEKLDPKNKQIPDAIKMAQLMAQKQASDPKK